MSYRQGKIKPGGIDGSEIIEVRGRKGITYESTIDAVTNLAVEEISPRIENLETQQLKILYYAEIDGGQTSGTISVPTEATILLNQWPAGIDAVISNIVNGKPDYKDTEIDVVSFNSSGEYTLSTTGGNPIAFIYYFVIDLVNLNTLNTDRIIDQSKLLQYPTNVITVSKGGGDYTTVKDAVDSITDNSSTNRYTILVAGGLYTEDNPIQCKEYTTISSIGLHAAVIYPANASTDLFTSADFTHLTGLVLGSVSGVSNYTINNSIAGNLTVEDCVFKDCSNGILGNNSGSLIEARNLTFKNPLSTTTVTAIEILDGSAILDGVLFRSSALCTIGIKVTGSGASASIHNISMSASLITTGISLTNGAQVAGTAITISQAYDGTVVSGTNTTVSFDSTKIAYCQNDGFRIDNTGTGIEFALFATTVINCGNLNFNVLNPNSTVLGNGYTELKDGYIVPGAGFYAYLLDITEGDAGLNILGELHVGTPENPTEAVFGEGDSTVRGMKVFTFDGTSTWVDVSLAASSASGSTFTYPALTADAAIYIGSELQQASDYYKHSGIKYSATIAGVMGTGSIVAEYWNGSAWIEINGMVTESTGLYHPSAREYFQEVGSFQLRLDTELSRTAAGWTVTNPMSYTVALYWIRYRITSLITTAPTFQQWKCHTNRFEPNSDGYIEYFGNARPIGQLPINIGTSKPISGNMQNEDIWIDDDIGVGYQVNKFTATTDILGLSTRVPFNVDTSSNIYFIWSGLFNTAHTPTFTLRWYWIEQGANLYTSNPTASGNSKSTTVSRAVLADINETFIAILDISDMIAKRPVNYGDELWITIQITTLSGTFSITTATADYIKWCEGGHI